jgi:hypothetical protein
MDGVNGKLTKLGASVSDTAERLSDEGELDASRRLFLHAPSRPRALSRGFVALAAAAALAALIVLGVRLRPPARISFQVGAPPSAGAVGEWVAADRGAPLAVRFSEGTRFTLAAGARARVAETTTHGATVLLEQGKLDARVEHAGPETRWSLRAGPFLVQVTGTVFEASWDPAAETFAVTMAEGSVVVLGPLLQSGRVLSAGERLLVSVRAGSLEVRAAGSAALPPGAAEPAPPLPPTSAPATPSALASAPARGPASAPASPTPSAPEPSWRDLAAAGKFGEALAAAERAGFGAEVERASSTDLAALADAARYGGKPALARQAILAQRRRFGARGASAFLLGKIAADQQVGGDAVRWFETYLQEEPAGALAEQALGRILTLSKGDAAAGRAAAERYLARYPNGVHAKLARSLLSP